MNQAAVLVMMVACAFALTAHAQKKDDWQISALSSQDFLFEKASNRQFVLLNINHVDDSDEVVARFIRSSGFTKMAKLLRTPASFGFEGQQVSVNVSRRQIGAQWVGTTESLFAMGDRSAVLTENWWVKSGLSVHVTVLTIGVVAASAEDQEHVFEPFAKDLGLMREPASSALFKTLIPDVEARSELNTSRGAPAAIQTQIRGWNSSPTSSTEIADCQKAASTMHIPPGLARKGPPKLSHAYASANCRAGITRVWTDAKKSITDIGTELGQRTREARAADALYGYDREAK